VNPKLFGCAPVCVKNFSYPEKERLLLVLGLFLIRGVAEVPSCPFDEFEVIPVEALSCDPVLAVRAWRGDATVIGDSKRECCASLVGVCGLEMIIPSLSACCES